MNKSFPFTLVVSLILFSACQEKSIKNNVAGTWKPEKVVVMEKNGNESFPYGAKPSGRLIFTDEMQFLEFIIDADIPPFQSDIRGNGTDEENRRLISGSFSLFGTYTVDEKGAFSGNVVEGSSFPNWVGDVRTTKELQMKVKGDTMMEDFSRPNGTKVRIVWKKVE